MGLFGWRRAADGRVAVTAEAAAGGRALEAGIAHLREGDLVQARAAFERATGDADPTVQAKAWVNLGTLARGEGGLDAARAAYMRAVDCDPALTPAYMNLASLALAAGRMGEAETRFHQVLAIDPVAESAIAGLARLLSLRGARAEALEMLTRAQAAHPGSARIAAQLAGERFRAGDTAGAFAAIAPMLEAPETAPEVLDAYAHLAESLGEVDQAVARLESHLASIADSALAPMPVAEHFRAHIARLRGLSTGEGV
ncbi:Tfp pilus assembly protein PilF [Natronocella acetinitrilica]|uniref:Tfp pilus assembly protein PilF n=1 Tax=Natronocella acetinitrilica TaxID=414046 RepID=A0AAE3G5D0_9GAMM|nr:tetratricopeptide repeat protein [Natronocella acetinitrilica]MCP1674157.1 Tfp pilus assembly protein PilF [Natronocella acetinitrilica]